MCIYIYIYIMYIHCIYIHMYRYIHYVCIYIYANIPLSIRMALSRLAANEEEHLPQLTLLGFQCDSTVVLMR